MRADHSHQALGQYAVQRGNKVVRLHAHIQEASQHVHHVIGVDGGENQVTGKGGVDGNLRGFLVADFAHHDFVRIVTQDGTQAPGKRESLFLVHGNLGDAMDLVFHRVLNGDDLVFVRLNLIQCRVERGGLTAARGACNQHHAVGFGNVAAELPQVVFVKPHHIQYQVAEFLAHRFFVQYAEHGVFSVNGRHNGHAEVDKAGVVFHPE